MIETLRYFFLESHIRWLLYILAFEYFVAITLSPTILSDYALANYFVQKMSFLDPVHVFDDLAIHPEATSFFIALSFVLLFPKAICWYIFLNNNPYSEMSQLVITPYTKYKPSRTLKLGEDLTENEAKELLTRERSLLSRLVWSLLSLGLVVLFVWVCLSIGNVPSGALPITHAAENSVLSGGLDMWLGLSIYRMTMAAMMLSVAFFIIKDYYFFLKAVVNKLLNYFNKDIMK